jgi:hypothetical protein
MAAVYGQYLYVSDDLTNYSVRLSNAHAAITDLPAATAGLPPYPHSRWSTRKVHVLVGGVHKTFPCTAANAGFVAGSGDGFGGVITGSTGEKRPSLGPLG